MKKIRIKRKGTWRRVGCWGAVLVVVGVPLTVYLVLLYSDILLDLPGPTQLRVYHRAVRGKPLPEKVLAATEDVIERLRIINKGYGRDITPRAIPLKHPLVERLKAMLVGLPPAISKLAGKPLLAIYPVQGDFGSGTSVAVMDEDFQWRAAYHAFNLSAFEGRTANQWGAWREASAFRPTKGYAVETTLEHPQDDTGDKTVDGNMDSAMQFVFLHELGHVLGQYLGAHDSWRDNYVGPLTSQSPFFKVSWQQPEPGKLTTPWREKYPRLGQLKFYAFEQASLEMSQAPEVYADLARTDFPSLYGASGPLEDFAESVAIYLHTQVLKKPYAVRVYKDGKLVRTYRSCITENHCPAKVQAIKALLKL